MTTALNVLRRWVEQLEAAEKADHWRTQPRVPAGVPEGGQWTDGPYSGSDGGGDSADFAHWIRTGRRRSIEPVNLDTHAQLAQAVAPELRDIDDLSRHWRIDRDDWDFFTDALAREPELTDAERASFALTYALEGGFIRNGGVTPGTYDSPWNNEHAKDEEDQRIDDRMLAAQLPESFSRFRASVNPDFQEDAAKFYKIYGDYALNIVGGAASLGEITDERSRMMLFDTLFKEGRNGGAQIVQMAINDVLRQLPRRERENIVTGGRIEVGQLSGPHAAVVGRITFDT